MVLKINDVFGNHLKKTVLMPLKVDLGKGKRGRKRRSKRSEQGKEKLAEEKVIREKDNGPVNSI